MADKEIKHFPNSYKGIQLTEEQELQVLHNILSRWSPFGLGRRYTFDVLEEMRVFISDAIEEKKKAAK